MVLFYLSLGVDPINPTSVLRLYDNTTQIFEKVITGLGETTRLIGIDLHPVTGKLYGVSVSLEKASLFIIDPNINPLVAPATLLGSLRNGLELITLESLFIGMDIDPNTNRLRIVSGTQNLSVQITGIDAGETEIQGPISDLNNIFGIAYTNPIVSANTQLFDIGLSSEVIGNLPTLLNQEPPETGALITIGPLQNLQQPNMINAGFDIITGPGDINEAYAVISSEETSIVTLNLYSVNLETAVLSFIGALGTFSFNDFGFTVINQQPVPCLHPKTKVQIDSNKSVFIDSLKAGDTVIDYLNKPIKIVNNVVFERSKEFYIIKKAALGSNKQGSIPENDLIIKKDHPVLFQGIEFKPEKLQKILGKSKVSNLILPNSVPVYSLSTEKRTFVMMENIPVCTWEYQDLLKKRNKFRFKLL